MYCGIIIMLGKRRTNYEVRIILGREIESFRKEEFPGTEDKNRFFGKAYIHVRRTENVVFEIFEADYLLVSDYDTGINRKGKDGLFQEILVYFTSLGLGPDNNI